MLVFPNCKINLGLHVTRKRNDGYHDLETVFYPVNWCDALEVIAGAQQPFSFSSTGFAIPGAVENNLIYKAWSIIRGRYEIPAIQVHLHKHIPMGAGLGGGSSNAACFINLVNTKLGLNMPGTERMAIAAELGSDCAFFINNLPVYATGKGDVFSPVLVDLAAYHLLVVYPGIHSDTRAAYADLTPRLPAVDLLDIVQNKPVTAWKDSLVNDFETTVFKKYPAIAALKQQMYDQGATYAAMSGSGSAVYALFAEAPAFTPTLPHFLQKPPALIL